MLRFYRRPNAFSIRIPKFTIVLSCIKIPRPKCFPVLFVVEPKRAEDDALPTNPKSAIPNPKPKGRCHLSLNKDPPEPRAIQARPPGNAEVIAIPRVGGIHHRYEWRKAA